MKFWWVNQNQTGRHEIAGGYMWSPKRRQDGAFNRFYENMRLVDAGDVVFSYIDQRIPYIGVIQGPAVSADRPIELANRPWNSDGWLVPVEWHRPPVVIKPKDLMDVLRPLLPKKYSPIQSATGDGLQSVYLAAVPQLMAAELLRPLGGWRPGADSTIAELDRSETAIDRLDDELERQIRNNTSIDRTERQAVVLARRGQGRFRRNLIGIENSCRITGIVDERLLRASHIKPWRACANNHERLDGNNGLLLAPHIDLLFDRGYISFEDGGTLLRSPRISSADFLRLGISTDTGFAVAPFNESQAKYLDYHRSTIFLQSTPEDERQNWDPR
ncbi:HNH endonuclease [Bradyrhizobium sp. HKCCYLS2038]|uniref:HNH endonuclease n=1 Tax=unclassified Bradyrhizobium TaxID=2631580 RepID=UPI003EBC9E69